MRRFAHPLLACLALLLVAGPEAGRAAETASAPLIVAVMPFKNQTEAKQYDWLGFGVADSLAAKLSSTRKFHVVERTQLRSVMQELKLADSGLIDESEAPKLGKMLGAKTMIIGLFAPVESGGRVQVRFMTKLVDTETTKVLSASGAHANGAIDDIFKLEELIAVGIVEGLGVKLEPQDREIMSRADCQSILAYEFYSQSLIETDADVRKRLLQKALQHDPAYTRAHLALAYLIYLTTPPAQPAPEFMTHIKQVIKADPDQPQARYLLASYLDRQLTRAGKDPASLKRAQIAVKYYGKFVELESASPLKLTQGKVKRARQRIEKLSAQFGL